MKVITSKTTRPMQATVRAYRTGEITIMAVMGRNLEESMGKAILLYGLDAVVKVYDPWTGDFWTNPTIK